MEGKDWLSDINIKIGHIAYNVRHRAGEISKKMDGNLQDAKKLLENIAPSFNSLASLREQPKILEIKAGDKEYVSVRRIDGPAILNEYTKKDVPTGGDEYSTQFVLTLPENYLNEGQILVLAVPDSIFVDCKNDLVEASIINQIGEDKIMDFGNLTYVAMTRERPDLFKKEEWTPSWLNVMLITRYNGKLYSMEVGTHVDVSSWARDTNRLKPSKDGKIEVDYAGFFQSAQDMSFFEDNLKLLGKVYILNEGSSEKETHINPSRLTSLETSSVKIK